MTAITASMPTRIASPSADTPTIGDPNELVGKGDTSARWLGGITGAALGTAVAAGLLAIGSKSPLPVVRGHALAGGLGAIAGGAFLGQKLLGDATRQTRAEVARTHESRQADLDIEFRIKQADLRGGLTRTQRDEASRLRDERQRLAEARPQANAIGKFVLPIVLGAGLMVAAGATAGKLTPDDGKGINAMFNAMMAGGVGGGFGVWAGVETGRAFLAGDRVADLSPDSKARIAEIDRRLDALLTPAG
jgi:hypothetical protein